jgi:hypothetical protein
MSRTTPNKAWKKKASSRVMIGIFSVLFLECVDDKVAGTTSSTENPSVIAMTFKTGGSPKNITGELQIFSAQHNPVFDSIPLAVFPLDARDSISISKKAMDSIVRNGEQEFKAAPDSLYSLNLLVHSDANEGGITRGLVYDGKASRFLDRGNTVKSAAMEIDSLIRYEGGLKIERADSTLVNYLYILGTPFFTILNNQSSRFSFSQMPKGGYKILFLPTGYKVTGSITYNIIALDDSLRTDSSHVFTPVAVEDTLQGLPSTPRGRD